MRLAVTRVGSGPRSVIFLHGFLGSGRNLATLARSWSQVDPSRSFLLMDLTGHGSSPPLPPGATLETLARDVLETAEAEGVASPATIVGHSLGGRVALQALLLHPERVAHVELLDIAPGPIGVPGDENTWLMGLLTAAPEVFASRTEARNTFISQGVPVALTEWLLTNLVADERGYRWRMNREALQALRPHITDTDLWAAVERFGVRVRCIRGARSAHVTDEDVARMERLGCRVSTLPDAGHFVHVDQPKRLLELLVANTDPSA